MHPAFPAIAFSPPQSVISSQPEPAKKQSITPIHSSSQRRFRYRPYQLIRRGASNWKSDNAVDATMFSHFLPSRLTAPQQKNIPYPSPEPARRHPIFEQQRPGLTAPAGRPATGSAQPAIAPDNVSNDHDLTGEQKYEKGKKITAADFRMPNGLFDQKNYARCITMQLAKKKGYINPDGSANMLDFNRDRRERSAKNKGFANYNAYYKHLNMRRAERGGAADVNSPHSAHPMTAANPMHATANPQTPGPLHYRPWLMSPAE